MSRCNRAHAGSISHAKSVHQTRAPHGVRSDECMRTCGSMRAARAKTSMGTAVCASSELMG